MKKTSIIFTCSLLLSSCYSYVAFDPENNTEVSNSINENNTDNGKLKNIRNATIEVLNEEDIPNINNPKIDKDKDKKKNKDKDKKKDKVNEAHNNEEPIDISITDIIKLNEFYKIDVSGKEYTIEAKQWKADTLYAIKKGKPTHNLKFHKDEIKDVKIRKFSKGKSDALTVAAYALGGLGIFLILK